MATTIKNKLVLTFGCDEGDNFGITLYDHKDDVDAETVANAMNEVLALEVLTNSDGHLAVDAIAAKKVQQIETQLF